MSSRLAKDSFVIGVISDTHGLLRPEAKRALRGSHLILHAGDIGSPTIVPALRRIAPVVAIRGNIDVAPEPWLRQFRATEVAEAREKSFCLIHNVRELDLKPKAAGFAAVVFGHSHKPEFYFEDDVLFFNPGSAGPRRFSLPISVGRITVRDNHLHPELIELKISK